MIQYKRVWIWRFTLALIKINYGQIGDQTELFYTTNPVFYTSGNRFVRRTVTFGNLWFFSLVPSDNRNTRSTCPTSVFTGIGQTLMSRPAPASRTKSRQDGRGISDYHWPREGSWSSMSWVVGLPINSYKSVTNTAWVCTRLCKLQKGVHSTRSRKW